MLLRRDSVLVDISGASRALRTPMPWPTEEPRAPQLTEKEAQLLVEAAAANCFGSQGFSISVDGQWLQLVRETDSVRQCIELTVSQSGREKGTMMLHLGMRFHCPKVREVWTRHFHDQVSAHVAAVMRRPAPEFSASADQFEDDPGPLSVALGGRKFTRAQTSDQLIAWVSQVSNWFDTVGRGVFEQTTTVTGLAHYALNAQQMHWLLLNNNLAIEEIFSRLVLASAFQPQRLDEWLAALRDHRHRKGRDPLFGKDLFVPDRSAVFEALAAWVASTDFEPEVHGLKA